MNAAWAAVLALAVYAPASGFPPDPSLPKNLPARQRTRIADLYAQHQAVGPALRLLHEVIRGPESPAERAAAARLAVSILQQAGREPEALALADEVLSTELPDVDRATLALTRVVLAVPLGVSEGVEDNLYEAWRLGDQDTRQDAGFRLVLRWKETGSTEDAVVRLAASGAPLDRLLLGHLYWSAASTRDQAATIYLERLRQGHWSARVAERLHAYLRLAGRGERLEELLQLAWAWSGDRMTRGRAGQDLLSLYRESGSLQERGAAWRTSLEAGSMEPLDAYLLALDAESTGDDGLAVRAWEQVLRSQPGFAEALEPVVRARLLAGDWAGLVATFTAPETARLLDARSRSWYLSALLEKLAIPAEEVVAGLGPYVDAASGDLGAVHVLAQQAWKVRAPSARAMYLRLAAEDPTQPDVLQRLVALDRQADDRDALRVHLQQVVECSAFHGPEGRVDLLLAWPFDSQDVQRGALVPGAAMELGRMALADGDPDRARSWAKQALNLAFPGQAVLMRKFAAQLLEQAGNVEEAAEILVEAVRLARDWDDRADVTEALARLALRAGRPHAARRLAEASLDLTRDGDGLRPAREALVQEAGRQVRAAGQGQPPAEGVWSGIIGAGVPALTLHLYYNPEMPGIGDVLARLENVRSALGDRATVALRSIEDLGAFLEMLGAERTYKVEIFRPALLVAGVRAYHSGDLSTALDKLASGAAALDHFAYSVENPAAAPPAKGNATPVVVPARSPDGAGRLWRNVLWIAAGLLLGAAVLLPGRRRPR